MSIGRDFHLKLGGWGDKFLSLSAPVQDRKRQRVPTDRFIRKKMEKYRKNVENEWQNTCEASKERIEGKPVGSESHSQGV